MSDPLLGGSATRSARRLVARALRPICVIITIMAVALILVGILGILGTIAYVSTHHRGTFENENITTVNLFVTNFQGTTGTFVDLVTTTFQSTSATITDLVTTALQSASGTITNLVTTTFQSASAAITNLVSTSITTDNLALKMQSFVVYNHAVNGSVVPSHNLQTISGASVVRVSLPASLTPFVGKEIEICNLDGKRHIVDTTPASTTWDTKGFWRVIQFDANSKGCCVTFKVVSSNTISLVSRGERCTTFCTTTSMVHCVDPERPADTNPWHGWWQRQGKRADNFDPFTGNCDTHINVDASGPFLRCSLFKGTRYSPRQPTREDISDALFRNVADAGLPIIFNLYPHTHNVAAVRQSTLTTGYGVQPGDTAFQLVDGRTLVQFNAGTRNLFNVQAIILFKKLEDLAVPAIIPFGTGTLTSADPNDPREILRHVAELYTAGGNPHIAKDLLDGQYIGYDASIALLDEIIATGKSHTSTVHQIYVTQNATNAPVTIIYTTDYHHVSPPGKVTISGCTGDWAGMNGVHIVSSGLTTNNIEADPLYLDYSTNASTRSIHHKVGIFYDSTGFSASASGVGTATGPCQLTVSYGPFTADTEYLKTISAIGYWIYETFGLFVHTRWRVFSHQTQGAVTGVLTTHEPVETWAQINAAYVVSSAPFFHNVRSRAEGGVSSFYPHGALYLNSNAFFHANLDSRLVHWFDINSRFGVYPKFGLTDPNEPYAYIIPRKNYLVDLKVLYMRCAGKNSPENLGQMMVRSPPNYVPVEPGYPFCSHLEGTLRDFSADPPAGYIFFDALLSPTTNYSALPARILESRKNKLFVGRVNPAYTNGQSIGYIRLADNVQSDRSQTFTYDESLRPPFVLPTDNRALDAFRNVWSPIMYYLVTELAVDDIIFDLRGGNGGFEQAIFGARSFFGTLNDTVGVRTTDSPTDHSQGETFSMTQHPLDNQASESLTAYGKVSPSVTGQLWPGTVFTGGNVYLITDTRSGSAGDLFPNYFLGPNLDKQLGGNTTVKIVGDLDARYSGANSGGNNIPYSRDSPRLRNNAGQATSGFQFTLDGFSTTPRRNNGQGMNNRHPSLAPDCMPSLQGLNGGCALPDDYETLVYPDLGHTTNTRSRLSGDLRPQQPDPNDPTTWRDAWLEQAIEDALIVPARRRNVQRDSSMRRPKRHLDVERSVPRSHSTQVLYPCPEGVPTTPIAQADRYIDFPAPNEIDSDSARVAAQVIDTFIAELEHGGMCVGADGNVYVTPACQGVPRFV